MGAFSEHTELSPEERDTHGSDDGWQVGALRAVLRGVGSVLLERAAGGGLRSPQMCTQLFPLALQLVCQGEWQSTPCLLENPEWPPNQPLLSEGQPRYGASLTDPAWGPRAACSPYEVVSQKLLVGGTVVIFNGVVGMWALKARHHSESQNLTLKTHFIKETGLRDCRYLPRFLFSKLSSGC